MMMVGCDFHPSFQQVAILDTETGEIEEKSLTHASGEAEQFYGQLARPALVGMEAVGNSQWFVGLLERWGMKFGSAMQRRSVPAPFASRRPTAEMRGTFSSC